MAFSLIFVSILIWPCIWGFLPNQFTLLSSGNDYTHQDITEIGILLAVAEFFEAHPLPGKTVIKGELTGIKDITARKLFDKYYGGTVSEKRFQEAIDDIVKANNRVDQDHYTEATWHVNGETIKAANDKITLLRETTINVLNKTNPNYDAARELIGQFLHIAQMFYSNTNWPELSGNAVFTPLGIRGQHIMAQAPLAMDTCRTCGASIHIPCTANLLIHGPILTSGYKSGQDIFKPPRDPKSHNSGKCSHGGPYDKSATTIAALGGINKDTSDPKMSPHFPLHQTAAQGAITHTKQYFSHPGTGLHDLLGDETFQEVLELTPGTSMVFVIDTTGSMGEDLRAVITKTQELIKDTMGTINQPYNYIVVTFNDPGNKTDIFESKDGAAVIKHLQSLSVHGGGDCPEFSLTGLQAAATVANPNSKVYVFTDATPKDADKINYVTSMVTEKKISVDFVLTGDCTKRRRYADPNQLDSIPVYEHISKRTGGRVHTHTESSQLTGQKKNERRSMSLLRSFIIDATTERVVHIDNTITELLIWIRSSSEPVIILNNTNAVNFQEVRRSLGHGVMEIAIKNPPTGPCFVSNSGYKDVDVRVYADSAIDFTDNIFHTHDNTGFIMHIDGRPVIGEQLTHSVTVDHEDLTSSIDFVLLYDSRGHELGRSSLTRRRERGHNYVGEIIVPNQSFRVAIEGKDNRGYIFQREKQVLIQPSNIAINVEKIKGDLHVGGQIQIDVKVINKGRNSQVIQLTTTDTLRLAVTPTNRPFKLAAGEQKNVSLVVNGGTVSGVSTTISIMANVMGNPDMTQHVTRTFTVHPQLEYLV